MKKIFVTLAAVIIAAAGAFAQDMAQATETAKIANEALVSGDYETALSGFREALSMAEACGDEGLELSATCKGAIPQVLNAMANGLIEAGNYDEALTKLKELVSTATEYGDDEAAGKAASKISQVLMQKGNSLINAKDFAAAAEAYKAVIAENPENGMAALRLGQALASIGNLEEAKDAFKTAAANGKEKDANKQLGNIALKQASAALKAKKYDDAIKAAEESISYVESAQAVQVVAQAYNQLGKNMDAAKYYERYLELAPNAKNSGAIAYTLGVIYQQAKNNDKAKEYYGKAVSDPKFGADAQKQLNTLK